MDFRDSGIDHLPLLSGLPMCFLRSYRSDPFGRFLTAFIRVDHLKDSVAHKESHRKKAKQTQIGGYENDHYAVGFCSNDRCDDGNSLCSALFDLHHRSESDEQIHKLVVEKRLNRRNIK